MSERVCSSCRHWQHERTDYQDTVRWAFPDDRPFDVRRDEHATLDRQYGHCDRIAMPPERKVGDLSLPLAVVMDGSDYKADLFTLGTFGCALWEGGE